MMENRIRELRRSHNLSQEAFSIIIGTTQQAVSRMEHGDYNIPSDLLIKISQHFNVATDYILGISEVKRDFNAQLRMNREMDLCYDIVLRYRNLSEINQKTLRCVLERLEQAQRETMELYAKEVDKNGKNSHM